MDHFNPKEQQSFNDPFITTNATTTIGETFSEHDIEELLNHTEAADLRCLPPAGAMFAAADGGCSPDLGVPYMIPDNLNRFSRCGNLNPKNSTVMMTMDSQSSICAESPTSDTNTKQGNGNMVSATSDFELSEDDDTEIEAGQCEQSNDQMEVKKHKRMVSNRESARRSRKRKQAHLTDLEQQVELLRVEYSDLFKQLTNASHQFKDASTNNIVLKSQVEALRAKVKLAEDMLARGSLTSSLSHLLQNHLTTPQMFNCQNTSRMGNVAPTITVRGDDHGHHPGLPVPGQHEMLGLGANPDVFHGSFNNGINSDGGSFVSNTWSG